MFLNINSSLNQMTKINKLLWEARQLLLDLRANRSVDDKYLCKIIDKIKKRIFKIEERKDAKMHKTITVQFKRNENYDAQKENIEYSGFDFLWQNGTPIKTGLDKFCQRGIKLFLGKNGLNQPNQLLELTVISINSENDPLPKTNCRSRRFYIKRENEKGIIHFMNGTPTDVIFNEEIDEPEVLNWIGLTPKLKNIAWFDMVVKTVDNNIAKQLCQQDFCHNGSLSQTSKYSSTSLI
jgi:hypothetical protein